MLDGVRRRHAGIALAVAATLLAAGCVGDRSSSSHESGTPGGGPASSDPTSDLPDAWGSRCRGVRAIIMTENDVFAPTYPPSVEPANSKLVSATVAVFECAEAGIGREVFRDLRFAFLLTLIKVPSGVGDVQAANFVHQAFANNATFAELAAQRSGLAVTVVPITVSLAPTGVRGQAVAVDVAGPSPQYSIRGTVDLQGQIGVHERRAMVYDQNATGTPAYFLLDYAGRGTNTAPGAVAFSAPSYWSSHSAAPASHATLGHEEGLSMTFGFRSFSGG